MGKKLFFNNRNVYYTQPSKLICSTSAHGDVVVVTGWKSTLKDCLLTTKCPF